MFFSDHADWRQKSNSYDPDAAGAAEIHKILHLELKVRIQFAVTFARQNRFAAYEVWKMRWLASGRPLYP